MSEQTEPQTESAKRPVLWLKDLQERWGVSDVTLWRMRRDHKIPAPTITLGKKVGWAVKVIEDFEQGRATAEAAPKQEQAGTEKAGQVVRIADAKARKRRMTQTDWVPPTRQ